MFAYLEIIDYVFLVLLFLFFTGSSAYAMFRPRDRARLFRVERKLDWILKHLNVDVTQFDALSPEAKKLADAGQKIPAIKLHREQTGLSLRDAKEDVEAYLTEPKRPAAP
jgi:hypothetical protein